MANNKSDTKEILQSTLDVTNQALKVNIVAAGGAGGIATEATLLLVEADTSSINTKMPTGLTIKAASTAAVATDQALVVAISPNNPIVLSGAVTINNGSGNPVPVTGTVTANAGTGTFAVSASSLPLPTGAATESTLSTLNSKVTAVNTGAVVVSSSALPTGASTSALQTTGNVSLSSIDGKIVAVNTGAVVVSSSALPTGAATSANQSTGNSSLSSIDTKIPALGQALAAGSVPVVLTAAQLSTLTPLSTVAVTQSTSPWVVSGTVTAANPSVSATASAPPASATYVGGSVTTAAPSYTTGQLNALSLNTAGGLRTDGSGVTQPISAASLPLPAGAATSANQTTSNSSLSSIDGKLGSQTDSNFGTPSSSTQRIAAMLGVGSAAVSVNSGAADAQTIRVVLANESNARVGRTPINGLAYTASALSTSFTSALSLQSGTTLVSTANYISVFSSTGTTLKLTWGGASPTVTNTLLIPPGGLDTCPVQIPSGSDIRLASLTGTSDGDVVVNFLS